MPSHIANDSHLPVRREEDSVTTETHAALARLPLPLPLPLPAAPQPSMHAASPLENASRDGVCVVGVGRLATHRSTGTCRRLV